MPEFSLPSAPVQPAARASALRRRPAERGQTLVLGALVCFVLALMLMLSFNLGQALHAKTSLQQDADAVAYSEGILEARALNYFAYSNRAIVSAFVAMTAMHAYMAAADITVAMLSAEEINFWEIAAEEFVKFLPCLDPFGGEGSCIHLEHAVGATEVAINVIEAISDQNTKVKNLDKPFTSTINGLDRLLDAIHSSQAAMATETSARLATGLGMDVIKAANAPQASDNAMAVQLLNVASFNCSIQGVPALPCVAGGGVALSNDSGSKLMTSIVNASRGPFAASRTIYGLPPIEPVYLSPVFWEKLSVELPEGGLSGPIPFTHLGTARVQASSNMFTLHSTTQGDLGKAVGADEHGLLSSIYEDSVGVFPYEAEVFSDSGSGQHFAIIGVVHDGSNHHFEGVNLTNEPCLTSGNCFVNFRHSTSRSDDWNQPHAYAYVTADLRKMRNGSHGPWELNAGGQLRFAHGQQGTATVKLAPGQGAAMARALVYYHRPKDWREHPNAFIPYWRVKLDGFSTVQAEEVLLAAEATDPSAVNSALLAVPLGPLH